MATLGHQSSPNSLLAQHGLRCALWVSGSRAAGLCPRPAGFGCARPRGAPDQQMQHRWREGRAFAGPSSAICWKIYEMTSTVADKETLKSFWEPLFVLCCCVALSLQRLLCGTRVFVQPGEACVADRSFSYFTWACWRFITIYQKPPVQARTEQRAIKGKEYNFLVGS